MSGRWDSHIATVNGYLADQKAKRAAKTAADAAAVPQPAVLPTMPDAGMPTDQWQGGDNMGAMGAAPEAADGAGRGWTGGFPNANTISSFMDVNPNTARAGLTALGMTNPALGMALGGMGLVGNAVNTTNNLDMLSGLGVNSGVASTIGGLLGYNGLSGNNTAALNAAMANNYSGFANLSPAQMQGDFNSGSWGGWSDIAAGMDAANSASGSGMAASNPSGGFADRGDISSEGLFQKGGYTGAGNDGVVQPHRKAGTVHEGELVIPHHMVKKMMRGLLR